MPVREIVARLRAEGARDYSRDVGEAAEETERFGETAQGSAERSSQAWRGMADETRSATDEYASQLGVAQQQTAGFSGAVDEHTAEANTAWHGVATATGSAVGDYSAHVGSAVEDTQTFAGETEETANTVEMSWGKIGTAVSGGLAAVGGGLEALNRSQQDTRDVAARVAGSIDTVTDEVLGAAAEMNNATRDVDELVAMMEIGSQRGLESIDELKEFAATWDTIGDATGENAPQLAQASTALEAVGVSARQPQEAMDAFGFVTRHTTSSIDGFLQMVEKVGRELGEQAPHVNEMAALLKAMQEQGLRAKQAQQEVRQALREADGDMQAALDTLGLTNSAVDDLESSLDRAAGEAQDFTSALEELTGPAIGVEEAVLGWDSAFSDLHSTLSENEATLARTNEEGRENRQAILGAVDAAQQHATAMIESGASTDEAAATINQHVSQLKKQMAQAGISKSAVSDYIAQLNLTPEKIETAVLADTGPAASDVQQFRSQISETSSTMDKYTSRVEGSSRAIEHNADAHAENRTTLQEWSSAAESAMSRYSGLTQAVELAGPIMMGAAGTIYVATAATSAYTAASGAATAASYALGAAFRFMLGPIGLAITAIGAAVAAGTYLYQNWGEVTSWIKDAWQSVGDFLSDLWDGIVATFKRGANAVLEPINSLIDAFNAVEITLPTIPDWVPVVGGKGGQTIGFDTPNVPTFSMSSSSAMGGHPTSSTAGGRTGQPGGFNTGGPVPGGGPDRDSVPAMLTPGEWVLSRSAVEGLGAETLAAIEQAGRRRRGGGDGLSAVEALFGGDAAGPGVLHRNLGGAVDFARSQAGDPYVWGAVGPHGFDCSGFTSALTNVAMGDRPYERRHTTATVDSDPAYARGLQSGLMLGVSTAGQLGGVGHMAATVAGMPAESSSGAGGVTVGANARSATDSLFRQLHGHRGFAGEAGALADPRGDESNVPFWGRPVLDAIASAIGSAFGVEGASWADGAVHDRPWRGIASVGERETELTTPVSLLDDRIDAGLARHDGAGRAAPEVNIYVDGDVVDPERWFERNKQAMGNAVLAELEDRLAW